MSALMYLNTDLRKIRLISDHSAGNYYVTRRMSVIYYFFADSCKVLDTIRFMTTKSLHYPGVLNLKILLS